MYIFWLLYTIIAIIFYIKYHREPIPEYYEHDWLDYLCDAIAAAFWFIAVILWVANKCKQ